MVRAKLRTPGAQRGAPGSAPLRTRGTQRRWRSTGCSEPLPRAVARRVTARLGAAATAAAHGKRVPRPVDVVAARSRGGPWFDRSLLRPPDTGGHRGQCGAHVPLVTRVLASARKPSVSQTEEERDEVLLRARCELQSEHQIEELDRVVE